MVEQPLRVVLVPASERSAFAAYVAGDPTYGPRLTPRRDPAGRGVSDVVLAGVFTPSALLGLFRLARAWIELQRGRTTIKVVIVGQAKEIIIDSRRDPTELVAELMRATGSAD